MMVHQVENPCHVACECAVSRASLSLCRPHGVVMPRLLRQVGVEAVARQDGDDVSAHISAWGMWEAGWSPPIRKGPSSMYALLSILGKPEPALARGMQVGRAAKACRGGETSREGLLIDVGAGIGLFSLAAAASGVQVVAIEPEKDNRQLLEDSVAINGLEERVTVLDDILGSGEGETVCLREGLGLKTMVYMSGSDVGSPQVPNFDAEKRRWMISPDRHTVADLPLEPWKKEGPKGCYAGWKPSVQHRLDNVVKKPLQEALSRRSGLSWTVLRVSTDTASILKGASLLLGGHLLEGMLPPSVVLIEVPALDLMAIPPVITALAAHGYNQTLFHSGSLCRDVPLPSKQQPNPSDIDVPPEIGRLVSPGAKWCRCQDHQLQAVITSHRADSVRGIRAATDSGPNSMSIILLHSSRISTPEGMQWLETMQVGSNGNGCVR